MAKPCIEANAMGLPPLDTWLILRMGWTGDVPPSPVQVRDWQLERLRDVVRHARENSPFYARSLADVEVGALLTVEDFARLPMMTPDDVRNGPEQLLCVSQDEIARVVTLQSSGTTGTPKRIFHTQEDLEATVDYFGWGMRNLVGPGQTAFVLMPGERPGGVGRLLVEALNRTGARAVTHGVMEDVGVALDHLLEEGADCIVGPAAHVNMLAREWEWRGLLQGQVQSVLLCWDAAPDAVVRNAEQAFGCRVFRHWGMIETGLGGAVECSPGSGMHLRETDVYLEIIDPQTGTSVPDGVFGEMVVTTSLRRGMPLIRYRTRDMGRIMPDRCVCGSPLRRLDPAVRRMDDCVHVGNDGFGLTKLNEFLYSLPGLWDFAACLHNETLHVVACGRESGLAGSVRSVLCAMPAIGHGVENGILHIEIETKNDGTPAVPGLGKRRLQIDMEC